MSPARMTTLPVLIFLIISPDPNFYILGRYLSNYLQKVNKECHCMNDNSAFLHFLIISPDPYF